MYVLVPVRVTVTVSRPVSVLRSFVQKVPGVFKMGFFSAIADFFVAVFRFILGVITSIVEWCREHPKAAACIFALIVAVFLTWWVTKDYTTKAVWKEANVKIDYLSGEVKKANEETKRRDEKITRIGTQSKTEQDLLLADITSLKERTNKIVSDYEKKVAVERAKNKHVTITNPATQKPIDVEVTPAGEIVCGRFSDSYVETINALVDEANSPIRLKSEGALK
jgi:hypothetical protein